MGVTGSFALFAFAALGGTAHADARVTDIWLCESQDCTQPEAWKNTIYAGDQVKIDAPGQDGLSRISVDTLLPDGTRVTTGHARVKIRISRRETAIVGENSELVLVDERDWMQQTGDLLMDLSDPFRVAFSDTEAVVEGTRFVVRAEGNAGVEATRGRVRVRRGAGSLPDGTPPEAVVSRGQRTVLLEGGDLAGFSYDHRAKQAPWREGAEGSSPVDSDRSQQVQEALNAEPEDRAAVLGAHLDGGTWGRWGQPTRYLYLRGGLGVWDWSQRLVQAPGTDVAAGSAWRLGGPFSGRVGLSFTWSAAEEYLTRLEAESAAVLEGASDEDTSADDDDSVWGAVAVTPEVGAAISIRAVTVGVQGKAGLVFTQPGSCSNFRTPDYQATVCPAYGATVIAGLRPPRLGPAARLMVGLEVGYMFTTGDRSGMLGRVVLSSDLDL